MSVVHSMSLLSTDVSTAQYYLQKSYVLYSVYVILLMTMYYCNVLYSIPVQVVITVYWRQYSVAFTDVFLLYIIS
jgi:hypothetical protein